MLEIMNEMTMNEKIIDSQKHGIIVCLKKYLGRHGLKNTGHSPT